MGKLDISSDNLLDGGAARDWARLDGYGDNGAVMFCVNQVEAAAGERAPRLLSEAPVVGQRVWLRLNRPFVFDSIAPFWCLYLPPRMQRHGPAGDDLCRLALVRCRLTRAPAKDSEDGAAAHVVVLETIGLCDLAGGPVTGTIDAATIERLTEKLVVEGGYTVLTRDLDGDAGEWAILRHDTELMDLLVYGAWNVDADRMWAGRARLSQASLS